MLILLLIALTAIAGTSQWPSIDAPLKTGTIAPQDAALVIGIEDYYELPKVPFATGDAQVFRDFLVYSRGIPPDQVELLDQTKNTGADKIRAAATRLGARVSKGGVAWIYFAGHGAASPKSKERLLMGVSTSPDAEVFENGTVEVAELERLAGSGGGQVILVLDTCYAGAGVADLKRFAVPSYMRDANRDTATWTAAGANELSGPIVNVGHGAFTYFAVGALRGWADGVLHQPDGRVTAQEAQEYVRQALRAVQIHDQTPVLRANEPDNWVLTEGPTLESGPDLAALKIGHQGPTTLPTAARASSSPLGLDGYYICSVKIVDGKPLHVNPRFRVYPDGSVVWFVTNTLHGPEKIISNYPPREDRLMMTAVPYALEGSELVISDFQGMRGKAKEASVRIALPSGEKWSEIAGTYGGWFNGFTLDLKPITGQCSYHQAN